MRQVLIYPGEDGFWIGECPSLPGCISQGTSHEEAIANIREAIEAYVAVLDLRRECVKGFGAAVSYEQVPRSDIF